MVSRRRARFHEDTDPRVHDGRTHGVIRVLALLGLALAACGGARNHESGDAEVGASCARLRALGPGRTPIDLLIRDARFVEDDGDTTCATLELESPHVAPSFVDSHVHLSYFPVHSDLSAAGVRAAVDLASPLEALSTPASELRVLRSGPMITPLGGYPTRSWGSDGYGLECATSTECEAAVDRLAAAGAHLVKVPVGALPEHDDATLHAIVRRAHESGLRVAAHALTEAAARRAADADVDLLAHTPTEPLTDETVARWAGRAVASTLSAFGGRDTTLDNLVRLHRAGATVLYGTDLGNTRNVGIDGRELELLGRAGLEPEAVLRAGTSTPAAFWSLPDLGALEAGREASFLVLDADPHDDPSTLARPLRVYRRGRPTGE